jgi:hypothetical protein
LRAYCTVKAGNRVFRPQFEYENFPVAAINRYQNWERVWAGLRTAGPGADGEELTFVAIGPDAEEAMKRIKEVLALSEEELGGTWSALFTPEGWRFGPEYFLGNVLEGHRAYRPPGVEWREE